jgi:serine/threonine protein kinase
MIGALGEGTFGLVFLLEIAETKTRYALKAIRKEYILHQGLESMVVSERSTQALVDSDFIVRLYMTYQDDTFVYLVQEPLMCGELFDLYHDQNFFCQIPAAKFYISCVTMGLHHMHQRRVIYRDLKLENCLVNEDGYVKLTDMGVAKIVIGKTYTVCGTADYIAPETLRQVGHNRAVDWWACGVLLFIMCSGRSPFDAPEVPLIYKNIIKGFSKVKFPDSFPSDLTDTIKSLCRKKPEERITMQKGGIDNLKEMPFFTGFNWDDLVAFKLAAPVRPPAPDISAIQKKELSCKFTFNVEQMVEWDGSGVSINMEVARDTLVTRNQRSSMLESAGLAAAHQQSMHAAMNAPRQHDDPR